MRMRCESFGNICGFLREQIMMQAMTTSNDSDSWCVKTLDLKDAYRQCAGATSSFAFSHNVVKELYTEGL